MNALVKFLGICAVLSLALGGLVFYFRVPSPPVHFGVETLEPDLKTSYQRGDPIELSLALRSNDPVRSLPLEAAAYLFTPTGMITLPKSDLELFPRKERVPLTFSVPASEDLAEGAYRLRVQFLHVLRSGAKVLLYELERAFLILAKPQPESLVSQPDPAAVPSAPPEARPPKPGKPSIGIVFRKPKGSYHYGQRLPVEVEVANRGDGSGQVDVEITGDFGEGFSKDMSLKIESQGRVPIREFQALDPSVPEGTYTLTATASPVEGGPLFEKATAKAQFQLVDAAPKVEFEDLPLNARVGEPVSFVLKGTDDRGLEQVTFHFFSGGLKDFQLFPMKLESGTPKQGSWGYVHEGFSEPGSYTFYAEARDVKSQRARTEEFSIVIQMR